MPRIEAQTYAGEYTSRITKDIYNQPTSPLHCSLADLYREVPVPLEMWLALWAFPGCSWVWSNIG